MRITTRRTALLRNILVAAAAAILGGWASLQVLGGTGGAAVEEERHVIAEASIGTVEESLTLNASATWTSKSTVSNLMSGTVTEVLHGDGEEMRAGDVLYSVDLQPVVAAVGDVPAFRTLAQGDSGEDVAQLQRLLTSTGHYSGEADGEFEYGLHWAVREWQTDTGAAVTGTVQLGAVLFLPELPARAALASDIAIGNAVSTGSSAAEILSERPEFTIALTENHARTVQSGMEVEISHDSGVWNAIVEETRLGESGETTAVLSGTDGAPICGDDCTEIALGDPVLLPSTIQVVPAVEGVTVPSAAVVTDAEGRTAVITEAGDSVMVEVIAGADGMVVVEGLEAGTRVRVPGKAPE